VLRISTKGRYGLRAVVDLAIHDGQSPVLLREIADRQDISRRYLEKIFSALKEAGIVESVRGAAGGYLLARQPSSIRVLEILEALEGPMVPVGCIEDADLCPRSGKCAPHELWEKLHDVACELLDSMTLEDMEANQRSCMRKGRRG